MQEWNHFSQTFNVNYKPAGLRAIWQKFVAFFTGKRYSVVDSIEINFLYQGDVEPDVVLSGLYITKVENGQKTIRSL